MCGFVTLTPSAAEVLCELYSAAEVNFNCTTSGLVKIIIFKNVFVIILYIQYK